ncbi:class I SAM-dependent methyltransferase [Oryzibacter oryziterrae]|uniref:class I SAM-dependent methyltransferase n=1 Tax=Oryzibacter oryziterrae TaxID=2766474 RepID=UPI001F01AA7F|nr:class I SAM-dependent methyltransferase [Oryzibacter oryziterrae]
MARKEPPRTANRSAPSQRAAKGGERAPERLKDSPRPERGPARPAGAPELKRPMPALLGPRLAQEAIGEVLVTEGWDDYRLLDMGEGAKLERYGALTVVRPEPQAMGPRRLAPAVWDAAGAAFTGDTEEEGPGRWRIAPGVGQTWEIGVDAIPIVCQLTSFRHVGIFAEQYAHWSWMAEKLKALASPSSFVPNGTRADPRGGAHAPRQEMPLVPNGTRADARGGAHAPKEGNQKPQLLNLFGYTGVASLIAAKAGAEVTHVDASKKSVAWGRDNQALAGLENAPIRWIVDDAVKFCEREVRRGRLYDGILLDPPRFGRGPDGEVWSLGEDLPHMLDLVRQILKPGPSFMVLTAYAIRASFLSIHELTADLFGHRLGRISSGELVVRETGDPSRPGRLLSTSMFSRFEGSSS